MYIVYANANITHLEVKIANISTYMQQTIPMGNNYFYFTFGNGLEYTKHASYTPN